MPSRIKKISLFIIVLLLSFFFYSGVKATSGACSWHGGVNCAAGPDWDGSVICNDGWRDSSVSYYSMVECRGYYYYNPTPPTPSCPLNSYYDSISGSCKCYSGYVVSNGRCISADQYCQDKYGFNAWYNILTDSCECNYGYVFSERTCIDGDILCHQKYGYNSYYDSLTNSCKCNYGYTFNSLRQCVSRDDYCQDLYGLNAEYDILTDKCVCKKGYVTDSTKTKCIDGNSYCRDKYGIHSSYDYWSEKCKCDSGYILSGSQCVNADTYCQNLYGTHSSYNLFAKICECDYGYELRNNQCVTSKISDISPSEEKPITFQQTTTDQQTTTESISNPVQEVITQESRPETKSPPQFGEEIEKPQKRQEQKKPFLSSVSSFFGSIFNTIKNFFSKIFH